MHLFECKIFVIPFFRALSQRSNVTVMRLTLRVFFHLPYILNAGETLSRDATCIALHFWKHLAIRISKSASFARNGDEETTAKIEIYVPRSRGASTRKRANNSRAHDSGNTRCRRVAVDALARRTRARVCDEKLRAGTSEFYVWHFVAEVCRLVADSPWKNSSVVSLQTFRSSKEHCGSPPPQPPSPSLVQIFARSRTHFFSLVKKFSGKTPLNIFLA